MNTFIYFSQVYNQLSEQEWIYRTHLARQMTLTIDELQTEIENLKKEKSRMVEHVDTNAGIINSLKKGVEASSALNIKFESELAASLVTLRSSNDETTSKQREIEQLNKKIELTIAENTNLKQLNASNEKATEMVSELELQIQELQSKMSESTDEWKNRTAAMEREIEQLHKQIEMKIGDNTKLEDQLNQMNIQVKEMVPELHRRIEDSERQSTEETAEKGSFRSYYSFF